MRTLIRFGVLESLGGLGVLVVFGLAEGLVYLLCFTMSYDSGVR